MGLDSVGDVILHVIISKLDIKHVAILVCVNKRLRALASDESLWAKFCAESFDISCPQDPLGNPVSSYKLCYQLWLEAFSMYPLPLVIRVKKCWNEIRNWMSLNFPEAGDTLQRGASEDEINDAERRLGVKLPISTKVLYRFCNGQEIQKFVTSKKEAQLGIIGGYWFYDHGVNVQLLSLRNAIMMTQKLIRRIEFLGRSKYIVVAVSSYMNKFFLLNCNNGQLYVGTSKLVFDGEMLPCVPPSLINLGQGTSQQNDALLPWLEEHLRRLQSGIIQLRSDPFRSISLYPEISPLCTKAVTNGVQIRSSAVFVPEMCDLEEDENKYFFSYSIRMCLLSQGVMLDGTFFPSCQLNWRYWIIRINDVVVSDISGEAVIGKYPILHLDGDEFIYESCSPMSSLPGSMEGTFTFVPGRITSPSGKQFDVEVARFPLELPDYIY